jgi:prepilin signal peptidase PulO-like enzyme (type II secretory pathway)
MVYEPPRLRRGEILAGASALALLIFLFALNWLTLGGRNRHGWDAIPILRWLLVVTALIALLLTLAQATRSGPGLPVALSTIVTVLGTVSTLLLIIRLLTTSAGLCAGAFLGLLAVIGIMVGGFDSFRREQGWTPGPEHPIETVPLSSSGGPGSTPVGS